MIGGAAALLLASLAGYGVAAAALRPVERMRRRAAGIQAADPGTRLPVPAARRRDRPAGRDAQRDARAPRGGVRPRADASSPTRATSCARRSRSSRPSSSWRCARAARASSSTRRAALGRRGDRPARPARRGPAGDRPRRRGPAADPRDAASRRATCWKTVAQRHARRGAALAVRRRRRHRPDADRLRLEQALGNLVDNALRHGGGDGRAARRARGDGVRAARARRRAGLPGRLLDRGVRALHARRCRARPRRRGPRPGDRRRDRPRARRDGRRAATAPTAGPRCGSTPRKEPETSSGAQNGAMRVLIVEDEAKLAGLDPARPARGRHGGRRRRRRARTRSGWPARPTTTRSCST